jgi:streptomycin 3"-adenylyltransferase
MEADTNNVNKQIEQCLGLLKDIFKEGLLGVYLYGSSLLGGLQKFSDIDLFAISNRATTHEEKEQLEKAMLDLSGAYGISKDFKPIELTIVVKSEVSPWHYPPKFDFLYGDWMRKDFESGNVEPWTTKVLPNLALVITQLLLSYKTLFGSDPNQLLGPVPYKDFLDATTAEIDSLMSDIDWDTRNVLLTLARIWSTLETDAIRSKTDAASWTIEKLPDEYKSVLERAKTILLGKTEEDWKDMHELIKPCADFMITKIKEQTLLIESSNFYDKKIKLA